MKSDPAVVTTNQQIVNSGVSFNLPSQTGLNFGYSVNTAVGEPRTAQDNQTLTNSMGISQTLLGQSVAVTYQTSDFSDKTKKTNDLQTNTIGSSLNLSLGSRVTSSLGATLTNTDDVVDKSVQKTQSLTASINMDIIKEKLSSQIWGTMTTTKDDDLVNKADRQDNSANVEFTYQIQSNMALTLGGYRNTTTDKMNSVNDTTANGGNARVSYSF